MADQRRYNTLVCSEESENPTYRGTSSFISPVTVPEPFVTWKFPLDLPNVKLDVIPYLHRTPAGDIPQFRHNFHVHNLVRNGNRYKYVCPTRHQKAPCPICDYMRTLSRNIPEESELYRSLIPKHRQLYFVKWVDGPEDQMDTIYILEQSQFMFGRILDERIKNREMTDAVESNWDKYADPVNGFTLRINYSKERFSGIEYPKISSIDPKPRIRQYSDAIYDKTIDLATCVNVQDYATLKERFFNDLNSNQSAEDNEEKKEQVTQSTQDGFNMAGGYSPITSEPVIPQDTVEDSTPF